ncbi:hypothetical protein BsWGS_00098 [Bradybaena similaris]
MGTLYEFLREARLEQFYPAFRANGITRSDALIALGMPEFYALGITSSEDKRRLIELVNIIKSVHSSGLSGSPDRRNSGTRQPYSSNTNFANITHENSPTSVRAVHNVKGQRSPNSRGTAGRDVRAVSVAQLEPSRDTIMQDVPNFSFKGTGMNLLRQISESSESDAAAADHSDHEQAAAQAAYRNTISPSTVRTSTSRGMAVERIHHSKKNSYNYGVHKVSTSAKPRIIRSSSHRSTGDERIKVCVRKRPVTRRELRAKEEDIVHTESTNTLIVNESKLAVDLKAYTLQHEFIFDEVFDETCTNEDVYVRAARPLISCIFNGGTATCFAYGQTGAGKTHTMLGNENAPGLYLLAGQDIFSIIQAGTHGRGLHVWVSFFEIYCGQLFDLLNRRNRLQAREDGSRQVCIAGLTETEAKSVNSLVQILEYGNSVRSKGASGVNPDSSRSHAILQLDIRNSEDVKVGKISFIDLAGSERASDVTDTDKQTRIEGAEINQSLLALKECIRSIDQDSRHTPFRQSKLTHILKDSFVGNSRTCMIANISPTQPACENTLNTLRYADRVKELRRDSSKTGTVGQAMNLLMNIPPTAHSIFHPSNILSSSTPVRVSSHPRRERSQTPIDLYLDPAESPLRGHNLQRKQKENLKSHHGHPAPQAPPAIYSRSSAHATAASQGSSAPPPDASPSESDQTDTDSCNVTYPVSAAARTSNRYVPVARSTDTEFDFPTSDFNNIENINDLNRSTYQEEQSLPQDKHSHILSQIPTEDPAISAAAAEIAVAPTLLSNIKPPVLRPVVYRSVDSSTGTASAEPFPPTPQITGLAKKTQPSLLVSPQMSRHVPHFKKSHSEDLDTSNDSINEDELFCEGPDTLIMPPSINNLDAHSALSTLATSKIISSLVVNKEAAILLTLDSGEVAGLSQEHKVTGNSIKSGTRKTNTSTSLYPVGTPSQPEYQSDKLQSDSSQRYQLLQSRMVGSPTPRLHTVLGDKFTYEDTDSFFNFASQQLSPSYQLLQQRVHSQSSDHSSSFPLQQRNTSSYKSNEESFHGSNVQYHSDGSDYGSQQKVSPSPTGEASGDSLDSVRASLSDQGQGERRYHNKTGMRKGRSDPMLALDTQRKKHTLPDPQSISKMLTRSNSSKAGRVARDVGWKVIHNELPVAHAGDGTPTGGDSQSEQGSGISANVDSQMASEQSEQGSGISANVDSQVASEQREHFSDSTSCSLTTVKERKIIPGARRSTRSKQLPQVPVLNSQLDMHASAGHIQPQDISQHVLDTSMTGFKLTVRNASAIVTEKLSSGAVFSPIHPPPVTNVSAQSAMGCPTSPLELVQPTPVTAAYTQSLGAEAMNTAQFEEKMQLLAAHEDQLATITSLCKYEMRLLLSAKKVMGKRGFDDYLRRVADILQQKMAAIVTLHEQISVYRSSHGPSSSVISSIATSVSESGTSLASSSHITQK